MSQSEQPYDVGDWIVHLTYGVGQIKKIEQKPIGGKEKKCYHVRTNDGIFWLPTDNADNKRVRPIASPNRIQRALRVLKKAPKKMANKFQTRQKRIKQACFDGDLKTDLMLVRDLNARQFRKGLNATERVAFNNIVNRFLQEWSLSKGIEIDEAYDLLEQFLEEGRKKSRKTAQKKSRAN